MAEKHVHKVYGSFPPWGKSVEFPATGGGGGNYAYYRVDSSLGEGIMEVVIMANIIKVMKDGVLSFEPSASFVALDIPIDTILALGFDKSLKLTNFQTGELVTIEEWLIPFLDQQFPRLTEEEFYRDPNVLIEGEFRIVSDYKDTNIILRYDEGMTWRDWINSSYNSGHSEDVPQYIKIFEDSEFVHWYFSNGWTGVIHYDNGGSSSIGADDLIRNQTYYTSISA